jgi:hypothetical protein
VESGKTLCFLARVTSTNMSPTQTTGDAQTLWGSRVSGLLKTNMAFFKDGTVMYEAACEMTFTGAGICDTDQLSLVSISSPPSLPH